VTFYEILVHVSLVLWILLCAVCIFGVLRILPGILNGRRRLDAMWDELYQKAGPLLDQTQHLMDQVGAIATTLSDDVERIDRTVIRATTSIEGMVELAEDRVSEINALLEVAVEEAEETFFSTAAIMRALRVGGRGRKKRRRVSRGERRHLG